MSKWLEKELQKNIEEYRFEDLFDLADVQKLTETISQTFEIGVVITAPDGTPITEPSNFCDFCKNVVRKTKKGLENCYHSDAVLGRMHSDGPIIQRCLSGGLMDAGISICVGGRHVASCLMGQVMMDGILEDEETNRRNAAAIGVDYEEYMTSLRKTPVKTMEQFESIVKLVGMIVQQLSELGYKNFLQKEEICYRKRLEEELEREKNTLQYLNTHDKLTGLYSRDYFEEMMEYYETHTEYYPVALISADINNLKLMNDVFGHSQGDLLIRTIADIMMENIPVRDGVVARCGGDEILVILPNTDYEEAKEYCKDVKSALAECRKCIIRPSVALGVHVAETPQANLSNCLRIADEAMYHDKDLIKMKQNIINDMHEILYERGILEREVVGKTVALVSEFCNYLKLGYQKVATIVLAAQIQDVGMIAVMDEVDIKKHKGADKSADQIRAICQHVEIGNRIAKMFEDSFPVAGIILQSHECYDGTGYPFGLKGEEISFEARMIYLVSSYVYKTNTSISGERITEEEAIMRIRSERGRRFDPDMADQFLEFLHKNN